ncbi:MAG: hypothetical protein PHH60_04090, partial [Candidatus Margulisbacteria bacterium]|nr:hypothetical protein [Candidatus Margulisiibacteriota bacterium]
ARSYAKSISSEDGIDLSLKVAMNSPTFGSNYTYTNYSANAATYLPAPLPHHVLTPKLYGFYSRGEQLEQSNFSWKYLPIRGYPSTDLSGNKGALLSTDYRFPLLYPETGFLFGGSFFDKLWGSLFYDLGGATFEQASNIKLKRSYGAELNLGTQLFWGYYWFNLKMVYAKGLDEGGEEGIYFTIEM